MLERIIELGLIWFKLVCLGVVLWVVLKMVVLFLMLVLGFMFKFFIIVVVVLER